MLNNTEDWLDPTAAYDPGVHLWEFGGEAEYYVQAVDLTGEYLGRRGFRRYRGMDGPELWEPPLSIETRHSATPMPSGTRNWIACGYGVRAPLRRLWSVPACWWKFAPAAGSLMRAR